MLLAVPLAPLAGSVLAGIWGTAFGGNKIGRGGSHTLTIAGVLIAFILSAITFNSVIFDGARFDAAMSRFGVMFFSDFDAAFANIRSGLKPGAELVFACWRSPADNPMAIIPGRAAAPYLPPSPPTDPLAPGRFAFADPERVRGILSRSGWNDIDITRLDAPTPIALADLVTLSLRMGPLAAALREADETTRGKVRDAVTTALEAEAVDGVVPMVAGCWLVTARA